MNAPQLTNGHGPHSGDPCPREQCRGRLVAYCSRAIATANVRIKYLHCNTCGCRPILNQQVIPLRYAPQRGERE